MTIKNIGIYKNLLSQLDRTVRHTRQGSFKTRERYYAAFKRFCGFLADNYRLEKLVNVKSKHIQAYADFMRNRGLSASTVKTDLTAIRFYHDQMANAKNTLPKNSQLNLKRRKFGGVDRTWSNAEFCRFTALCLGLDRFGYICIACLGYYCGFRIEECFKLDTSQAEQAIKTNILTVKGKNGLVRSVPSHPSVNIALKKTLETMLRGQKLFVEPPDKTHLAIKRLQNFINYHRENIKDKNSDIRLTFHGLRHTFAHSKYDEFKEKGLSDYAARKEVSKLLGHQRDNVTRIYLSKAGDDYV